MIHTHPAFSFAFWLPWRVLVVLMSAVGCMLLAEAASQFYQHAAALRRARHRQLGRVDLRFTSLDGGRTWRFRDYPRVLVASPLTDALQDVATDLYHRRPVGQTSVSKAYRLEDR